MEYRRLVAKRVVVNARVLEHPDEFFHSEERS